MAVAHVTGAWDARWTRFGALCLIASLVLLSLQMADGPLSVVLVGGALMGAAFGFSWAFMSRRVLAALRLNAPYVALTIALCATRLVPPLRDTLKPLWAFRPYDNQPAFAPLYAPGFWLLSIGLVVIVAARASLAAIAVETAKAAWRSCAVTLAFVLMAELYVGSGMAQQIAEAMRATVGRGAATAVPLFAGVGGFLTGGGSAANAMLMPMVTALARALALDAGWIAAVQNSVCTNLTMLSPIRISMGAAILSLVASDAALYRRAWPLAVPPLAVGVAAVALLLYAPAS